MPRHLFWSMAHQAATLHDLSMSVFVSACEGAIDIEAIARTHAAGKWWRRH